MSTLENTGCEERLCEAFEIAICDDRDLQGHIAYQTLNSIDYYLFCKEDAWDKVDWDDVWTKVLEQFYAMEGKCYDIGYLCEMAFNIKF